MKEKKRVKWLGGDEVTKLRGGKAAFTLIELIVVMAVIGILVLLAAPKFLGYTQKAQETKHIHTAKVIETALEAYLIHGGVFPDDLEIVDEAALTEAVGNKSLYGVNGLKGSTDGETYYELTHEFIQKLDVKLSAKNELFIEVMASSVPTALYASKKGITLVDKAKPLKGYVLQTGELPNEINRDDVKQIVAGVYHSLALMEDGSVMAWGQNTYGQLGDGTTINKNTPVAVLNLTGVRELAAGRNYSMALMKNGSVMAWGQNDNGQLGDGSKTQRNTPTKVTGLTGTVKKLRTGSYHSLALMESGSVMTWGRNDYAQLGDGTTIDKFTPFTIANLTEVIELEVGWGHSLALLNDGTVKAWGMNNYGQLGDGTTISKSNPVTIAGLNGVKELVAGAYHSLALMENGTINTWGRNEEGQLGNGNTTNQSTSITIADLTNVKDVTAGFYHSFALLNDGSVEAWGYNNYGQLGDGSTTNRSTPVTVVGLIGVKELAAEIFHSLAIMEDGGVKAWGRNIEEQLSDRTTVNKSTPVNVKNVDNSSFNINQTK